MHAKASKEGKSSNRLNFPKDFLWGVSTSSHQVEGGTKNQWTEWELNNAKTLAAQAEYQFGDLDNWSEIEQDAKNPRNYISGVSTGHYERFEADFDIAHKMNFGAWRFSIEWSRVEPQEGVWDEKEISHYKEYVKALKRRGLEPIVTLFHFTLPVWFADKGGFARRQNVQYFVRYAEKIISELGISVKFIITINEPNVYVYQSYIDGTWPPQVRSKHVAYHVTHNLAQAHIKAADKIRKLNRRYKVSVAYNSTFVYPGDDALLSRLYAAGRQYVMDDYFLKKVVKQCDFLGVNYYFSERVYGYRVHNPNHSQSDLGSDLAPENIEHVLVRLHEKYHLPIIITENGIADASDDKRLWWLQKTIIGMRNAINEGVQLQGYCHWSLLDNFEWDKGFWPKFGLVEVDYVTLRRRPRPSAIWLAKFLKRARK